MYQSIYTLKKNYVDDDAYQMRSNMALVPSLRHGLNFNTPLQAMLWLWN